MSLILEALRKSEAERQRGRAPDLHAAVAPAAARAARRPSPWPWLIALSAVLVAALFAWRSQTPVVPAPAPTTSPEANAPVSNAAPRFEALPPRAASARPEPASSHEPSAPIERAAASATSTPAAMPNPGHPTPEIQPELAQAPSPEPAIAEPPPVVEGNDRAVDSLAMLDNGQRAALPALKVSMHVWNAEPAQRFVIVDGQRLGEGGRIGEAVIEQIDRDGAILAWRERRLRLPRP